MAWTPPAAPGWYPDPLGRHEHRYWDGVAWTGHVADRGATGLDPTDVAVTSGPTPGVGTPAGPTPTGPPPTGPGTAAPSAPPSRSGPPVALIAGLAVAVVAVIGIVA